MWEVILLILLLWPPSYTQPWHPEPYSWNVPRSTLRRIGLGNMKVIRE